MAKTIGIDLGTTNSAMAVLEAGEPQDAALDGVEQRQLVRGGMHGP